VGATPRARLFLRGRANVRPRDWAAAMAETVLLAMVLLAFTRLHAVVGTDVATATANALAVQSVEQMLHLNIELATNRWLTEHETVIPAAVLVYRFYYAALLWVLVWIYIRHAEVYVQVRRTFVAMTGLAVLAFWAMPTSPPRFALPGVVDIFAEHDILNSRSTRDMSNGANFTAMPSLHVAWSAWCAYAVWSAVRGAHPRAALLAWLLPVVMVADVLATGNHYLLDVVGSGVLLIASIAIATGWGRLVGHRFRPSLR
jgi:PAP2 superfamily